ncbi:MAG: hypothetical protein NDJ19_00660 [Ramlibacter sp.]|nr:hypothetical protein [Ramlibacter sp.]
MPAQSSSQSGSFPGLTLKAWALVANVAGNVAQTLVKSSNVTSITRIGAGNFTVVLTTNLSTASYVVVGEVGGTGGTLLALTQQSKAVGGGSVRCDSPAGVLTDPPSGWYLAYYE